METILSLLGGGGGLYAILAAVVAAVGALLFARRSGVKAERGKQAIETVKRTEAGRKGAAKAVDKLAKGKTPAEIKRENDAKWNG